MHFLLLVLLLLVYLFLLLRYLVLLLRLEKLLLLLLRLLRLHLLLLRLLVRVARCNTCTRWGTQNCGRFVAIHGERLSTRNWYRLR